MTGTYPPGNPSPTTEEQDQEPSSTTARSASRENRKPTDYFDAGKWQHLLRQLHRYGWAEEGRGAITWGFVMRMRQRYGSRVVDSALSDACLSTEAPKFAAAPYFQSICERFAAMGKAS